MPEKGQLGNDACKASLGRMMERPDATRAMLRENAEVLRYAGTTPPALCHVECLSSDHAKATGFRGRLGRGGSVARSVQKMCRSRRKENGDGVWRNKVKRFCQEKKDQSE